nr:hypothetical protein HUO10_000113 [Paraburkholderia busanensis]
MMPFVQAAELEEIRQVSLDKRGFLFKFTAGGSNR